MPLSSACSSATRSGLVERSMPSTVAPRAAIDSARIPPPQPTSTTRLPERSACSSIQSRRSGFISCNGRISPERSHQRCARSPNFCSSAASTFELMNADGTADEKSPAAAGPFVAVESLLRDGLGADHFDLDAAVLLPALRGLVVRDRLARALALGVDAVGFDALAHQVFLDRFRTAQRQPIVQCGRAGVVGMPNHDDYLELRA